VFLDQTLGTMIGGSLVKVHIFVVHF